MSMFSRISKEAKILIGITSLAAASLIWFNFITQQRQGFNPISLGPSSATLPGSPTVQIPQTPRATAEPLATPEPVVVTEAPSSDIAALEPESAAISAVNPETSTDLSQSQVDTSTASIPDVPQATLPAVPVASPEIQAISVVEIAELPFLVTSPPSPLLETTETETTALSSGASEAQRASINPFAPLVLVEPAATPTASSAIVNVPIPDRPQTIVETSPGPSTVISVAPPPALSLEASPPTRNVAAPMMATTGLLRPLPSGSLGTTPTILTQALAPNVATPTPAEPKTEPSLVLTSAPTVLAPKPSTQTPVLTSSTAGVEVNQTESGLALITTPLVEEPEQTPVGNTSTAVGASTLSRYLRDNNVRFTGSVIGPVSVGVFRSNNTSTPMIVSLGQSFPDTDFVLSSLKGQQAEIKDDDDVQTLALDLWR